MQSVYRYCSFCPLTLTMIFPLKTQPLPNTDCIVEAIDGLGVRLTVLLVVEICKCVFGPGPASLSPSASLGTNSIAQLPENFQCKCNYLLYYSEPYLK